MASNLITIGSSSGNSEEFPAGVRAYYQDEWENFRGSGVSEIQEELSSDQMFNNNNNNINNNPALGTIREESVLSFDFEERGEDIVYVAVGKQGEETLSMDALVWTLNNVVIDPSSTLVFLVHIFPETKYIPTPLGKLPINQVNPEQKEKYMAQERDKRRDFLQKFLNVCSASQVKVDTILIESEMEAKAILDLIPILNIRKLVLGATKSTVRRMRSRRGNGVADQILQNAPEFCEVKIICEGKEMSELTVESPFPSPSPSPSPRATDHPTSKFAQDQTKIDSFACGCFKI